MESGLGGDRESFSPPVTRMSRKSLTAPMVIVHSSFKRTQDSRLSDQIQALEGLRLATREGTRRESKAMTSSPIEEGSGTAVRDG
jgi:hypothetical protein